MDIYFKDIFYFLDYKKKKNLKFSIPRDTICERP